MNNLLSYEQRIKTVLINLKAELASMQVLLIELENNPIKNFGPKTLEKIKQNTGYHVYYKKDKIDVLNKFCLAYNEIDSYGYTRNGWNEFNVFNCDELIKELKTMIEYKQESIKKAKYTIKNKKSIINRYKKIIELKKINHYTNFNSQMLDLIKETIEDNYYIKN